MASNHASGGTHLIVGPHSLLGRLVLEQLLCFEPHARIRRVVDHANEAELAVVGLNPSARARVEILHGNSRHIDWGLSGPEYMGLLTTVDRVYSLSPGVAAHADKETADEVGRAVGRELLEFGRAAKRLEALVFFSSAQINRVRSASVSGEEPPTEAHYQAAPDRAPALVERILLRQPGELPLVIVRSGVMVGDAESGEMDAASSMWQLITAARSVPEGTVVTDMDWTAPVYPVATDFVARAGYYASRTPHAVGKIFRLLPGHPISAGHLAKLVLQACGRPTSGEPKKSRLALERSQAETAFWRAAGQLAGPEVYFHTPNTDELLRDSGITCPFLDDYVPRLVDFARFHSSS